MSRTTLIRLIILAILLLVFAAAWQVVGQVENERWRMVYMTILFVVGGLAVGLFTAFFLMPLASERIARFFYDSPEEVEPDAGSHARALVAQGEYEEAMGAYLDLARAEPDNRLPVVEAMRLAREKLAQPEAAAAIIREAMARRAWPEDDEAYFLFRLVEITDDDLGRRDEAVALLRRVISRFPETRHSANARHKLREWNLQA
jgi:tetratricopeptide (TPR) repeat protein